jgi:hypothetical protein
MRVEYTCLCPRKLRASVRALTASVVPGSLVPEWRDCQCQCLIMSSYHAWWAVGFEPVPEIHNLITNCTRCEEGTVRDDPDGEASVAN